MKRIVICCDGTWNSPGDTADGEPVKTNVQKLFESVCNLDENGIQQIKHYVEGVGTAGSKVRKIVDGATGWGLAQNIINAYSFLVWNYVKGDEIYLFGFSRGAYTARSLGGLIRNCGIIRNDDLGLINQSYLNYRRRDDKEWAPDGEKAKAFRAAYSVESSIKCIGVWDTVGSLGIPLSIFRALNSNKYKFHDTTLSSYVDFAFQALAIDEKRKSFAPTLWEQSENAVNRTVPQVLIQRWFSGVHSNIGGGYPDSRLSDVVLTWMVEKIKLTGLAIDPTYTKNHIHADTSGKLYNSFVWPFSWAGEAVREISFKPSFQSSVDQTAFTRWENSQDYRPRNLRSIIEVK